MPAFAQPSIDFYAPSFSVLTNFSTGATSDGSTVIGYSRTLSGEYGYRWDKAAGKQWLDGTSTGRYFVTGQVSDDLKVVGYRQSTEGPFQALQWTPSGGILPVAGSEPNSQALANTRDGRYIVGWQQDAAGNRRGRMWNSAGVVLGDSAWLGDSSQVVDLSDDAAVTVGFAAIEGRQEAFRRLESGDIQRLGFLDPTKPTRSSRAVAVSNDGQVIVGTNRADMRSVGFRWSESGGMVALPNDSRGFPMQPYGVSGDGSVIVGFTATPEGLNALGVLMTPDGTVWDVKSYLLSLGLPVEQYNFRSVRTVSADGLTIAGVADLIGGASDYGFVATLPAPMSCSPLVFAILANRRRR